MRQIGVILGLFFLIMAFLIVGCGDDGDDNDQDNNQPDTPSTTTVDSEQTDDENLLSGFDEADIPFSEDVIMKHDLTLLTSNYFVQDDYVYVMYVVRNDSDETIRNINYSVVIIDEDRLPLTNFSFSSPYNNIPPGQVIAVGRSYFMDERWAQYYDGVAVVITAEADPEETYTAYFETDEDAQLVDENKVQGSATNVSSDPLTLLTATFALYDENDDIVAVIPAVPISGVDAEGYWQPGVTISFEASVLTVPDGDFSAVSDVQLVIAGYALDF